MTAVGNEGLSMSEQDEEKSQVVLEVEHLSIAYETRAGDVEAVRDVSFSVREGETVGLVGESGCGKSTIAYGIVNHLGPNGKITRGHIRFQETELVGRSRRELKEIRGNRIAMVFQDPMQALNPSLRLGAQLTEVLTCHRNISRKDAWKRCVRMLRRVNMPDPDDVMRRYPHQISGGQQQRVVIAMAMLNNPALLIMDEPTTALDVTVEAAVLDLIEELKRDFNTANIFITHNLGVVAEMCQDVVVMYLGKVVEQAPVRPLYHDPKHPYTQGLLHSIPSLASRRKRLEPITGVVPDPLDAPPGCPFNPRCPHVMEPCTRAMPPLEEIAPHHQVACWLYKGNA